MAAEPFANAAAEADLFFGRYSPTKLAYELALRVRHSPESLPQELLASSKEEQASQTYC